MDCGTFYEVNDIPHLEEHGIEVQLPFARHLHPGAKIVPILVGRTTMAVVKSLATGLRLVFGKTRAKTLFVVSSDLAFAPTPAESARLSDRFVDLLLRASWQELVEEELGVCGAACAAALFAGGIVEEARLLGRHGGGGERENADDAYGEYAAFAMR
jgi:AmmeMemoRadiSam system protein B